MSVYSMTGYASAQRGNANTTPDTDAKSGTSSHLAVEIRSVNSRYLDLSFRLSDELRSFEPALRELLVNHLKRGKIEIRVSIENSTCALISEPSMRLLQRINAIQDNVRTWLPQAALLSVADVMRLAANDTVPQRDWQPDIIELTQQALKDFLSARAREGSRLAAMLKDRIKQLRVLVAQAEPLVPQLVAQQRQRFMDRWQEVTGLVDGKLLPEAAHDRALAEATAFAIRIDVAEELTRLNSHLDELDRLINKGGEIGKRLDFLIQELHREANTLGSKSAMLELTHISVDMKVLIEQLREQVQNIE